MGALRRILSLAILALAFLFLLDSLAFRTPFYRQILAPASAAGSFENVLAATRDRALVGRHHVVVCGDSQIAEGFSAKRATQAVLGKGWSFDNAAVAGASMKVWYYMLRSVDARARFDVVAIPFRDYADESEGDLGANREIDLNMVITRLGLADVPAFVSSFPDPAVRLRVLRGALLKGLIYRRDLRDLLSSPGARMEAVAFWGQYRTQLIDDYPGLDQTLAGLTVDWKTRQFSFPPQVPDSIRTAVAGRYASYALRVDPAEHTYRAWAIGRILDLCRNSNVRVVFFKPPQRPLPPDIELPESGSYVARQRTNPRVTVLPRHAFDDLQRPENFADASHLNRKGRAEFSVRLATEMVRALSDHTGESL